MHTEVLSPCHTRAASLQRSHSVKKVQIGEVRAVQSLAKLCARCAIALYAMRRRLFRHSHRAARTSARYLNVRKQMFNSLLSPCHTKRRKR